MFLSKCPDLVLLDIMLPGVDGIEVCRQMRADPLLAATPLISLTAVTSIDIVGLRPSRLASQSRNRLSFFRGAIW